MDFPGLSAEIGLREKTDILRRVASHMQADPGGLKGNMIDGATLTGVIEDYLRGELHFDQARAAARTVVDHLRLRNFILCFVGADSYAFVHRTFLEYFCAAEFVHRFNIAKTLDLDGLIALFDDHCRQDEWREVLRLICGQIDEAFVGRIVERLATRTDLEKWDGDTPLPELPLAIECLAEVRSPAKIASNADVLLQSLIRCVSSRGTRGLIHFLHEKILPASRGLGEKWPTSKPLSDRAFEIADSIAGWGDLSWPEFVATVDPNRFVIEQFLRHSKWEFRASACRALAAKWPDEATRALLEQRAVQDDHYAPRRDALQALAATWPDETTRALLEQRAVQDDHYAPRHAALQALAAKWPDEATHALLATWTTEAPHPDVRSDALQALAATWPDETTRALLEQRAVQDDHYAPRRAAPRFRRWPSSGPTRRRAPCSPSGPSRIRTIRCGAKFFPRWARCTPSLAASCPRETSMARSRISIRCNRFLPITSDRQLKRPTSVPTTSTPKSRRSRPTWDGMSPAARSHRVKERSEENVPERGANSTSERAKRIRFFQPWAENRSLAIGKDPECPRTEIASDSATPVRSRGSRSAIADIRRV